MDREVAYFTVDEAAGALHLTPERVREMLLSGELEGIPPERSRDREWRVVMLPVQGRDLRRDPQPQTPGSPPAEPATTSEPDVPDVTGSSEPDKATPSKDTATSPVEAAAEPAATSREPSAPSGWVSTQQAARALGISPRTVRWHIEQGNLEAKPEGEGVKRTWLVSIDSLQAFRDARQVAGESPRDYRAPAEAADIAAAAPGNAIRELADRLVHEAARASEYRVRLEITAQAESTLREELASERRRREQVERERDQLRRDLEAAQEARESPVTPSGSPEVVTPSPASGGPQTARERPFAEVARVERRRFWRRMFGR